MPQLKLTKEEAIKKLQEEINSFLASNSAFFANQGNRLSCYFEMACYNHIVSYYRNSGWVITVQNLINETQFKYKLTPAGYPENFSYFAIYKDIDSANQLKRVQFEIHHNLCIQSAIDDDIYITPDISIINEGALVHDDKHYLKGHYKKFSYIKNTDLQTFCEVKQFNPFPELLYSFMGMYYELVPIKSGDGQPAVFEHIAPSLMISGKGNIHTERIRELLEKRGEMNILFDLFENGKFKFGKKSAQNLTHIKAKNYDFIETDRGNETESFDVVDDSNDDLPF